MIEEIVWYQYKQMSYKGTCVCKKEWGGLEKKCPHHKAPCGALQGKSITP